MSDSRLEKFIYAICSMDVSDLPVPLSRIEKLWNCLITGETPDFEPLSRNEKYLMAMLDRYDISNLPAPMSRGEKLLYKIAVGETDLTDVPGYLSRYEELLKYLIENGGISGGDFEYVLYTLNQSLYTLYTTAEKPVKSAILKGQTLVNLMTSYMDEKLVQYANPPASQNVANVSMLKPNTEYTLFYKAKYQEEGNTGNLFIRFTSDGGGDIIVSQNYKFTTQYQQCVCKFTTPSTVNYFVFRSNGHFFHVKEAMLLEGDHTQGVVPYFTGMQSVKMPVLTTTGKNLFDGYLEKGWSSTDGSLIDMDRTRTNLISVEKNETYTVSRNKKTTLKIDEFDGNSNFIKTSTYQTANVTLTTSAQTKYIRVLIAEPLDEVANHGLQLEKGTVATSYEPFKSNILTVNEDVELRGIGDVRDELNCLTGEVTERIGEVVLDGSEDWVLQTNPIDVRGPIYRISITDIDTTISNTLINCICDKAMVGSWSTIYNTLKNKTFAVLQNQQLRIQFDGTLEELKIWLAETQPTIQYFKQMSVKTVDLTVVDQDNQPTELGTFKNVTHVSLEAENLIPEVEMEVATNLLEDTVFNLTNAFNTLYLTAAKPVKSAILKGQTLVNLFKNKDTFRDTTKFDYVENGDKIQVTFKDGVSNGWLGFSFKENIPFEIGKTYTVMNELYECDDKLTSFNISLGNKTFSIAQPTIGINKLKITIPTDYTEGTNWIYYIDNTNNGGTTIFSSNLLILEGDYTQEDIPYFTGMQSVKMPVLTTTGKNLMQPNNLIIGGSNFWSSEQYGYTTNNQRMTCESLIDIDGTSVTVSICDGYHVGVQEYNSLGYKNNTVDTGWVASPCTLTLKNGTKKINIIVRRTDDGVLTEQDDNNIQNSIQVESGTIASTYEPYKSNILTVNEDVTLRGIGDVQDELNSLTGELTQHIGEIVLDGSENWQRLKQGRYYLNNILNNVNRPDIDIVNFKCDKLKTISYKKEYNGTLGIALYETTDYDFIVRTDIQTTEEFKQWLSNNPTTVQYQLKTKSIKTVDLTVVDQDGNETKLGTFDDTTHVLLNSEGLVPTASLTVRTKIPSASSTSLSMDDISTEQQQLEITVDEQSNNVDATMVATTEIYEETL